jgi:hypothetical protein
MNGGTSKNHIAEQFTRFPSREVKVDHAFVVTPFFYIFI